MKLIRLAVMALALTAAACNNSQQKNLANISEYEHKQAIGNTYDKFEDSTAQIAGPQEDHKKEPGIKNQIPAANKDWDKKIIKTANLSMEIASYDSFTQVLKEKIKSSGGYIAQEIQSQSTYKIENSIVVKVPVDQFDNALALIGSVGGKLKEKKITSQDISSEVFDTRSRIETKKQVRLRYLDLLKQAKNMNEILQVQSEINDLQVDIEGASGRVGYLTHEAAYSTINLTYFQIVNPEAQKKSERPSFGKDLKIAFLSGIEGISIALIALTYLWPIILLTLALIFALKKIRGSQTLPGKI